jgi:hypothetical protein
MSDIPFDNPQTAAEQEAAIAWMLSEMQHMNEQIRRKQANIDRLKAESLALRNETEAILLRLEAAVSC